MHPLGIIPLSRSTTRFGLLQLGKPKVAGLPEELKPHFEQSMANNAKAFLEGYLTPIINDLQRNEVHRGLKVEFYPMVTFDPAQVEVYAVGVSVQDQDFTEKSGEQRATAYGNDPRYITQKDYLKAKLYAAVQAYQAQSRKS